MGVIGGEGGKVLNRQFNVYSIGIEIGNSIGNSMQYNGFTNFICFDLSFMF